MKLFIECANSDGLKGFYYSHDGIWSTGYEAQGSKTKLECANTCMHDCFGIDTWAFTTTGQCYHYKDRSDLIVENEVIYSISKAYLKCPGKNE